MASQTYESGVSTSCDRETTRSWCDTAASESKLWWHQYIVSGSLSVLQRIECLHNGSCTHYIAWIYTLYKIWSAMLISKDWGCKEVLHHPKKTRANTTRASSIWREWVWVPLSAKELGYILNNDITKTNTPSIYFWIQKFVLEVRKKDSESYCPNILYQLCWGLPRALRDSRRNI